MTRRALRFFLAAAAFALAAGAAFASGGAASAQEEKSLLAPDGTLYSVRSGYASDLGLTDPDVSASDYVVAWSSRRQDGSVAQGVVPDTAGHSLKRDLQLAYDEPTGSLVLLWKEDFTVLNVLRLGIFRSGAWTLANLLPNLGFAHAYNPQMLLSHQTVSVQNDDGSSASHTRTILSVIWWEEAQYVQARFAPIFLDEVSDASDVQVYDLPTVGGRRRSPDSYRRTDPGSLHVPGAADRGDRGSDSRELRRPGLQQALRHPRHVPEQPRQARIRTTSRGSAGASRSSASLPRARSPTACLAGSTASSR